MISQQESMSVSYFSEQEDYKDIFNTIISSDVSKLPDNTMFKESVIQSEAEKRGIRLILSGWGGDEGASFFGKGLMSYWLTSGQWEKLVNSLGLRRDPKGFVHGLKSIWQHAIVPLLPNFLYFLQSPFLFDEFETRVFVNPDFEKTYGSSVRPRTLPLRECSSPLKTQLHLFENGHLTNRMDSWALFGSRHGISYAYPLTDRRVLEFAYSIPADLYYQQGINRYIYRYSMDRIFPNGIAWGKLKQEPGLNWRFQEIMNHPQQLHTSNPIISIMLQNHYLSDEYLARPHPWVNTESLGEAVRSIRQGISRDDFPIIRSIYRALKCIIVYENR